MMERTTSGNPPGYEGVKFILPDLPTGPFMLDEQDNPDAPGLDGPYEKDDFDIDPETNTMLSIPIAGHWHYWRFLSQVGNNLVMVDGGGKTHQYKIVPMPDNTLTAEDPPPLTQERINGIVAGTDVMS